MTAGYDLIVVGGGPGGCKAAALAGRSGMRTLLLEAGQPGGVCLFEGCIPTKATLYSAKILEGAKHGAAYGVYADGLRLDHERVLARRDKVVKTLALGVKASLRSAGVQVVKARGESVTRKGGQLAVSAEGEVYTADRVLVATGARAVWPPIQGLPTQRERGFAVTSGELLAMRTIPGRLVVVGGGVIGLELASYFHAAGSEVTVIEALPEIGGGLDGDIAALLRRNYEKKGIAFRLSARVTEIGDGFMMGEGSAGVFTVEADTVLISVGRRADGGGLDLSALDIAIGSGGLMADSYGRTAAAGLYAVGDVTGRVMLAHAAVRQAEAAVCHMRGIDDAFDPVVVPSVMYTNPEVASVGETEGSARQKGLTIEVVKLSMRQSGRYLAENEGGDGICKLIVGQGRLLGVHLIANGASELIAGAALAVNSRMPVDEVKRVTFPHPTVSEIIKEGLELL